MLSLLIDTHEGRNTVIADMVRSYLLVDTEDYLLEKLSGEVVDIMCKVNNRYTPYIVLENGEKVLYMRLIKAMYGYM